MEEIFCYLNISDGKLQTFKLRQFDINYNRQYSTSLCLHETKLCESSWNPKKNFRGVRGSRKTATIKVNIDIKTKLQILQPNYYSSGSIKPRSVMGTLLIDVHQNSIFRLFFQVSLVACEWKAWQCIECQEGFKGTLFPGKWRSTAGMLILL